MPFLLPPVRLLPLLVLAMVTSVAAPADAVTHLAASVEARNKKDFAVAVREASAAIALCPHSAEGYLERAFAHFGAKDSAAAAADFKAAVDADPTCARAYLYRGDLAYRLIEGNFAACEADYATVLRLEPDYPGFRAYSAELYLYLKKPDRVITEAVQGLQAEPHSAIHKINLAHGLAFAGQIEAAKALYRALATVDIGHGRRGAAFALGDFATLRKKGVDYPAMVELTPFLQSLADAAGDSHR
ncbi:MAG: hypothetical protein JNN01_18430 [Opitutaceae bacterium]|nr:hypothetical protein [Opitutaceae bacterium]